MKTWELHEATTWDQIGVYFQQEVAKILTCENTIRIPHILDDIRSELQKLNRRPKETRRRITARSHLLSRRRAGAI